MLQALHSNSTSPSTYNERNWLYISNINDSNKRADLRGVIENF